MAWKISSWLVSIRLFQLVGALVSAGMNAFLILHIYNNHLGLSERMIIVELMIGALFVYTSLTLLISHAGKRGKRSAWLVCMVICDVVFCCLDIAAITLLANSGVPGNCGGLTDVDYTKDVGDKARSPKPGFTTIGFSDGSDGKRGELDKYCGLERSFYFVAIAILFSYMLTIAVSVLRLCEGKIYSQSEVNQMMESQERMIELEQKINDSRSNLSPVNASPVMDSRFSQGVLPPRASIPAGPPPPPIPERPEYSESGPSRRISFASSSPTAVNPASPVLSFASLEHHANMAMVTDGSRYNNHIGIQLPPYSPGNMAPMNGHGGENNDIRLSDYVKGETRAQDMKDAGRF